MIHGLERCDNVSQLARRSRSLITYCIRRNKRGIMFLVSFEKWKWYIRNERVTVNEKKKKKKQNYIHRLSNLWIIQFELNIKNVNIENFSGLRQIGLPFITLSLLLLYTFLANNFARFGCECFLFFYVTRNIFLSSLKSSYISLRHTFNGIL